jgi:hypothetical protein
MKCNERLSKWCKNKHGASKIIDTLETYQSSNRLIKSIHVNNFDSILHTKGVYLFKKIFPSTIMSQVLKLLFCEFNEIHSIYNVLVPPLQGSSQVICDAK